jgi:hypothetical protein
MAVEKARVVARIKELFPKLNLSQKRMDALADKLSKTPADDADDAAVDVVLNGFNEVMPFDEIARNDDRSRQYDLEKANRAKEKAKADRLAANPGSAEEEEEEEFDANTPEWAKAMAKNIGGLSKKMSDFEAGKQTETKRSLADKAFAKSEVLKGLKPETKQRWLSRMDISKEDTFESQVTELEAEYSELVQDRADSTDYGGGAGKGTPAKVSQEEVDQVINSMKV